MKKTMMSIARHALIGLLWIPAMAFGTHASKSISFRIEVPALAMAHGTTAPSTMQITDAEVAQGYVDVPVMYSVWTNNARGFALNAQLIGHCCDSIEAVDHASGRARNLTVSFRADRAPGVFPALVTYRVWLRTGIGPGSYPWPVQAFPLIAEP